MSIFDFNDDQRKHLSNWLLGILPSWSGADPKLLAQYIITLVDGKKGSYEELQAKCVNKLTIFTEKTCEFVNFLFEALTKQSYIGDEAQANKTQNETTLDKLVLDDQLEATETKKLPCENTTSDSYSNSSQKRRYYRFDDEKNRNNRQQAATKNLSSFSNDENLKHHIINHPSNANEKLDNPIKNSKTVNKKSNYGPYTWKHGDKFRYDKTKNAMKFPSQSELKPNSYDRADTLNHYGSNQTIDEKTANEEHGRLCPKIQEKGVCDQGIYCPYNPAVPNVSGDSFNQYRHLIDENYNFDLEKYAHQNSMMISTNFSFANSHFPKVKSTPTNYPLDQRVRDLFPYMIKENSLKANTVQENVESESPMLNVKNQELEMDQTIDVRTALIIKHIPADMNRVPNLISYFQQFGTIVCCKDNFQNDASTALIQFSNPFEATKAVRSPQAVFNNRFIRVYRAYKEPNIKSQLSSVDKPTFDNYKRKFSNSLIESNVENPKKLKPMTSNINESRPKAKQISHVNSLNKSIDETLANHEHLIKKLEEAATVKEKKAIMNLVESNMRMITELKEKIMKN